LHCFAEQLAVFFQTVSRKENAGFLAGKNGLFKGKKSQNLTG
jgi:hypothetical protein